MLTSFFNKYYEEKVDVNHNKIPEFIYYEKMAYDNKKPLFNELRFLFNGGRLEYMLNSMLNHKIYLETNNRATFFAEIIKNDYPKAKFIHLIRNPYKFIRSGVSRNWYTGKSIYDLGRIRENETKKWENLNNFEKVAFLWNQTNLFIEQFKKKIPNEDQITIKSDLMFKNKNELINLIEFLGLPKISTKKIKKHLTKPINQQKKNKIPPVENWKAKEIKLVNKYLDDSLMEKYSFNYYVV